MLNWIETISLFTIFLQLDMSDLSFIGLLIIGFCELGFYELGFYELGLTNSFRPVPSIVIYQANLQLVKIDTAIVTSFR